jgi:hypothetical protein
MTVMAKHCTQKFKTVMSCYPAILMQILVNGFNSHSQKYLTLSVLLVEESIVTGEYHNLLKVTDKLDGIYLVHLSSNGDSG